MDARDILEDAFGRIREDVERAVIGLDALALAFRPEPEANSIGWLVWHLTRVQDHHISDIAGRGQAWVSDGWAARFGMEADSENTGYGHTSAQVAGVRPDGPDLLIDYHDAVHVRTLDYVRGLAEPELTRIVDERWDPPVTAAVRLVSVVNDDMQHAGQANYVRGILERTTTD